MYLIVALGNPGKEYSDTRHNLGFAALDFYLKKSSIKFEKQPKFGALWAKSGDTIFIEPQGYYNASGLPVEQFLHYYKIPNTHLLVICDDFCIPFGTLRLREKGSSGGNNGLKSIISSLNTENFPRLRLGTGNDTLRKQLGDIDFVLSRFTSEEKSKISEIFQKVSEEITKFQN